jgi:hypothetical protein
MQPTWYLAVFTLSILLSIVGAISLARRSKGNASLREQLQRSVEAYDAISQSQRNILTYELSVMSQILKFGSTERISLYKHDGKAALVMIGRYAKNPLFGRPGRGLLEETEGVVGNAFQNDYAFVDDLPEINGDDDFAYLGSCCLKWRMKEKEVRALIMKSRTLGAYAINDSHEKRIAVIVFESTNKSGFTEEALRNLLTESQMTRLSLLLEEIQATTPSPSLALQRGF